MSDPIDRAVDALTGCCSHCDDMAWGKADDLHAAGLLVTPAHDAAVAAKALREAADWLVREHEVWPGARYRIEHVAGDLKGHAFDIEREGGADV